MNSFHDNRTIKIGNKVYGCSGFSLELVENNKEKVTYRVTEKYWEIVNITDKQSNQKDAITINKHNI